MRRIIAIVLFIVLLLWATTFLIMLVVPEWQDRSAIGDMFGAVNALFAGLAFAGIIIAIYLQTQELGLQRQELAETRTELQRQAEAQEKSEMALSDQVHALHRQADALIAQTEALHRPYISIWVEMGSDTLRQLRIVNVGRSTAENLRLSIDKSFYPFGMKDIPNVFRNLAECFLFTQELRAFEPGTTIYFALALGDTLEDATPDSDLTPTVFTITATYSFVGKQFKEVHVVDLRQFNDSMVKKDYHLDQFKKIADSLKKIETHVEKIRDNLNARK